MLAGMVRFPSRPRGRRHFLTASAGAGLGAMLWPLQALAAEETRDPSTALLFRLQHRSGVFGTFGGVWDASNFLTIGLRRQF